MKNQRSGISLTVCPRRGTSTRTACRNCLANCLRASCRCQGKVGSLRTQIGRFRPQFAAWNARRYYNEAIGDLGGNAPEGLSQLKELRWGELPKSSKVRSLISNRHGSIGCAGWWNFDCLELDWNETEHRIARPLFMSRTCWPVATMRMPATVVPWHVGTGRIGRWDNLRLVSSDPHPLFASW